MNRLSKKLLSVFLASLMVPLSMVPLSIVTVTAKNTETVIQLSNDSILVNGSAITEDASSSVYLDKNTENHSDVPEELKTLENKVITIIDGGRYRFSGSIDDSQIKVAADENDEVTIILDNASITCRTAPAIMITSAKEPATPGLSGVTLYLEENSTNEVTGSHTTKTEENNIKYDAAIDSLVSLTIDGTGTLKVNADNEGIEVKNKHLTINNGNIHIISCDDPINGSEDGVAHITINGGWIFCSSENGKEGDGIDSNGYITINGGTLIALGNPKSMDGGLDSDLGTTINGGTVVGAGNMYDPIETSGEQLFMFLQFRDVTEDILCITDKENHPIFAYDFPFHYSYISFSSPNLKEGTYKVFLGGEVEGTQKDGLYTDISSYSAGTAMYHGGVATGGNRGFDGMNEIAPPPEPPEGMTPPPWGERPEGKEPPPWGERPRHPENQWPPKNTEFPDSEKPPIGERHPGGMQSSAEVATPDFIVNRENGSYTNVTSDQTLTQRFTDVPRDAWFYPSVENAAQQGLLKGTGNNRFSPDDALTGAEWMTILARLAQQAADTNDIWYEAAINWGTEHQIIHRDGWQFDPGTPITREQMADMIYAFAETMELNTTVSGELSTFVDCHDISAYANKGFVWAVGSGILQGDGISLTPKANLTRAEGAEVLMKLNRIMHQPKHGDSTDLSSL